ncbi:MAG: GIY-YIG nuclease family protein [Paludibacteraceae bacterium]|nr:GIY-YIG nuclease family protein [Paludibacteraceae bacterium]
MCGIYKITNKINGKIYIGQAKNICARWNEHYLLSRNEDLTHIQNDTSLIHRAIRKHHIENFTFEVLTLCDKDSLNEEEQYFISYYDSLVPKGYNILGGGNKGPEMHGEDNPNAKLTAEMVHEIRERYKNIETYRDVYASYQNIVSINTFHDVWIGKTWKHVHMDVYTEENKKKQRNNYDKVKSHNHCQVLNDEDILNIRNLKNDGFSRAFVYNTYYKHININTFSDVWYNRTFQHIQSDHPVVSAPRCRMANQDGVLNPSAKFSKDDVIEILKRKNAGEYIRNVYKDFNHVTYGCFKNLWDRKTYKNIEEKDNE